MAMNPTKFKHAANMGDLLAAMASLKKFYELTGSQVIVAQQLNLIANYPAGSNHPVVHEDGRKVCFNETMMKLARPLLLSQEYIADMEVYEGQEIKYDLDVIRQKTFTNIPYMALQQWVMLAYPNMAADLSKPWVIVPEHPEAEKYRDKIILNFTDRYRNHIINYFFLKQYQSHLLFAGTATEHKQFCEEWKLEMPLLVVNDFLELAQIIKASRFLVANQSSLWNLAEAMKTPRILEMSTGAPNCQPFIGKDSFGFFHQIGVEWYVNEMFYRKDGTQDFCPCCGSIANKDFHKMGFDYFTCVSCNTTYVPIGISNDNMVGGGMEEERNRQQNDDRLKRVAVLSGINGRKLDFGCGHGMLVEDAKRSGFDYYGYDRFNPEFDRKPEGKFNFISMVEVIEHLSKPYYELDMINEMMEPGGTLYIETSFVDVAEEDSIDLKDFFYVNPEAGHATIFSHVGLDQLMVKKGFHAGKHINRTSRVYVKN